METYARYIMIDEREFAKFAGLKPSDMLLRMTALERSNDVLNIKRFWDGLHFLLTGFPSDKIDISNKGPISQGILGSEELNEDGTIAQITHPDLERIVRAYNAIDVNTLKLRFDPKQFQQARIYPYNWLDNDKELLLKYLLSALHQISSFHNEAYDNNMYVMIRIGKLGRKACSSSCRKDRNPA